MVLYTGIHFLIGRNPDKTDWGYVILSWLAWIGAVSFLGLRSNRLFWDRFGEVALQILISLLFIYPIYVIGKSLKIQWQEKAVYIWDVLLFLLFVAVALLVATGQLYVRQEWLDAFFDRV